jgi:hypothetical protein
MSTPLVNVEQLAAIAALTQPSTWRASATVVCLRTVTVLIVQSLLPVNIVFMSSKSNEVKNILTGKK